MALFQGWVTAKDYFHLPDQVRQAEIDRVLANCQNINLLIQATPDNDYLALNYLQMFRSWAIENALRDPNVRFVTLPYAICFKGDLYRCDFLPDYFDDQEHYRQQASRRCEFFGNAHENRVLTEMIDLKEVFENV